MVIFHSYVELPEGIWNHQEWSRMRIFLFNSFVAGFWFAGFAHSPWHFVGQLRPLPKVFLANTCEAKGLYLSSHSPGQGWFTCVLHVSRLCSKNKVANVCVCVNTCAQIHMCSHVYMQIIWAWILMNMYTYAIYIIMCIYIYTII